MRSSPERFMETRYVEHVKAEEIVDWLDFANESEKGIEWIDHRREKPTWMPKMKKKLNKEEVVEIEVIRMLNARSKILEGYVSQHHLMESAKKTPSEMQAHRSAPTREKYRRVFHLSV